jgi:hypothetical protein
MGVGLVHVENLSDNAGKKGVRYKTWARGCVTPPALLDNYLDFVIIPSEILPALISTNLEAALWPRR